MKTSRSNFLVHTNFLTMTSVSLSCCWEKVFFPHEYMVDWEKFSEASTPEKEDFYSYLNMEDITDADYTHAKRVCKDFEIKSLGEYHDLHF